ncbi:MAG: cell filamentation protein Fic [Alphaproteobacteria bacterium]|nr:cell filamentation protein Fic [Alphaproteobacteria bacterium]
MPKLSLSDYPEVFVSNAALTKTISRYTKEGKLRKLASRLYTKNLIDPPEVIIKRNLWMIVGAFFPGAVISDRTAIENKPSIDGSVFLVSPQKNTIKLPEVTIRPRKGAPPLQNDRPFVGGLFLSSPERAFLENIKVSRVRSKGVSRTLSRKELEEKLEELLQSRGVDALNALRDNAKKIASSLNLVKEYKSFDKLVGCLFGTKSGALESKCGLARQSGFSYDTKRLHLFSVLRDALGSTSPVSRISPIVSPHELMNLSFFEAYFSNFIEGTKFEIQEAVDIIFKSKIPPHRPEDAHDIFGTFKVVSNMQEMRRIPQHFDEFLSLLKSRHVSVMEGRPDKLPGEFKTIPNQVGTTVFVSPDLVLGTLKQGFDLYQSIDCPLYRAVFMMFLIAEVHPFMDGNGRVARIMMNAELISASEQRIIIPTVYRNNYLSALRALSLNKIAEPLIRVLDFAQKYTVSLDYKDFDVACALLEQTHAFLDPNEAEERGLRLKLPTMPP